MPRGRTHYESLCLSIWWIRTPYKMGCKRKVEVNAAVMLRNMPFLKCLDVLFKWQVLKNRRECITQDGEAERFMAH